MAVGRNGTVSALDYHRVPRGMPDQTHKLGWRVCSSRVRKPLLCLSLRYILNLLLACSDDLLSKIWYAGAYTTKVNLLSDQIGAILIYRGDRFSWTGDG